MENPIKNITYTGLAVFGIYNLYVFFTNGYNIDEILKVDYFQNMVHFSSSPVTNEIFGDMLVGLYAGLLIGSLIGILWLIGKIFGVEMFGES